MDDPILDIRNLSKTYANGVHALRDVTLMTHPDDRMEDLTLVRQLVAGDIPVFRRQSRYVTRDGRTVWVQSVVSLLRSPSGEPARIVAVVEDITEHLRLADAERARSLAEDQAVMTALGNDYSYDEIFARQLINFANEGDIVFVMSVSGNSPNLVKAVAWAKEKRIRVIALVGAAQGKLAAMADLAVVVNDSHYGRVEDAHMGICHMIAYAFMELPDFQKKG